MINALRLTLSPRELTPGKTDFKFSAAASAFPLPPDKQSVNPNKLCRTGFENETVPLSINVMCRMPQPYEYTNNTVS